MSRVIASQVLANGLRTEFADTYTAIRNRQADGRLGMVMDLNVQATNRQHEFAYFEAAPHFKFWQRGNTIPQDAMSSVQWTNYVYEWALRIPWSKWDRKDDQTQSLMDVARQGGESAALLPERFFFECLAQGISGGSASLLPAVPLAPDGLYLFDSNTRFEDTSGNIVSGSGITTIHDVHTDFYTAIERFMAFKDGQGQPLLSAETISQGVIVIHASADTQIFEQAFLQVRHGIGMDNTGARGGTVVASSAETNLISDAGRNVTLWGSPRLATGDWYIFLRNPPKQPLFLLDREGLQEYTALEGDNNSDHVRTTAEEYIQWELRQGVGVALPYGCIKVDN